MPLTFNTVLRGVGVDPAQVRLVRHQAHRAERGRTPYELWRDDRPKFEVYQRLQSFKSRAKFEAPYWASFVGTRDGQTLFVGLYAVRYLGLLRADSPRPHRAGVDAAGSCDEYEMVIQPSMANLDGRLVIDWGDGARAWIQRADRQDKTVVEIRRRFEEPAFPGFMEFREPDRRAAEGLGRGPAFESWCLPADVPQDEGAVRGLSDRRGVLLAALGRVRPHGSRRERWPQEPRPERLPGLDP